MPNFIYNTWNCFNILGIKDYYLQYANNNVKLILINNIKETMQLALQNMNGKYKILQANVI